MQQVTQVTPGSTLRVTWVSSGAAASPIAYNLFNGSETLVGSWAGVDSGNGFYYADIRIGSVGLWKGSWFAFVSPNSYRSDEMFAAFPYDTDQPGRYITWDDVVNRFTSFADVQGAVKAASHYIMYAEALVDQKLATAYTVPFSSNNITARDLAIDVVQLRFLRSSNSEEYKALLADVTSRFYALREGLEAMVTIDGAIIQVSGNVAWCNTQDYHPMFSPVLPEEQLSPSSSWLSDEENARGIFN